MDYGITTAIERALLSLWADVIGIIPELVAALVLFAGGIAVSVLLGSIAERLVRLLHVDELATKFQVHELLERLQLHFTFSKIFGVVVKWFFIVVFLNASVEVLGWTQITAFLNEVLLYIPNVLVAIAIMAIGLIVAQFVRGVVRQALRSGKAPVEHPEVLADVARWAIVVFAVMAAVSQLGVAAQLIEILFAGFVFALALAFGLAGKERAGAMLQKLK